MKSKRENLTRPLRVMLALASTLLMGAAPGHTPSFHFNIAAQSMSSALREYARISGQQIIFTEDLVEGIEVAPLLGDFTAVVALSRLLTGTPLTVEVSPSGALMIRAAASQK